MMWRIKRIYRGIRNFWRFRKEVYNFEAWDYEYNMQLFIKSLEFTILEIEKNQRHEGWKDNTQTIKNFVNTYNKIWDEDHRDKKWMEKEEYNYKSTMNYLRDHLRDWWD